MNLPLPRLCPKCRHFARLKQRSGLEINKQKCQCLGGISEGGVYKNTTIHSHGQNRCSNEFETNYNEDSGIIYCEECYQKEVY